MKKVLMWIKIYIQEFIYNKAVGTSSDLFLVRLFILYVCKKENKVFTNFRNEIFYILFDFFPQM